MKYKYNIHAPGLIWRIEANQYRCVDLRVLQAEVQLTCHKRSLRSQKSQKKLEVCKILRREHSDFDQLERLTDNPQEIPMNKTRLFPSQACRSAKTCSGQKVPRLKHTHTLLHSVPHLLQTEHAQSGVILRGFLGRQQSSEENKRNTLLIFTYWK